MKHFRVPCIITIKISVVIVTGTVLLQEVYEFAGKVSREFDG